MPHLDTILPKCITSVHMIEIRTRAFVSEEPNMTQLAWPAEPRCQNMWINMKPHMQDYMVLQRRFYTSPSAISNSIYSMSVCDLFMGNFHHTVTTAQDVLLQVIARPHRLSMTCSPALYTIHTYRIKIISKSWTWKGLNCYGMPTRVQPSYIFTLKNSVFTIMSYF